MTLYDVEYSEAIEVIGGAHVLNGLEGIHAYSARHVERGDIEQPVFGGERSGERVDGGRRGGTSSRPSVIIRVGPSPAAANTLSRSDASLTSAARRSRRHLGAMDAMIGILIVEHGRKIDFDPTQGGGKLQTPRARVEAGSEAKDGGDAVRRYGIGHQAVEEVAAYADSEAHHVEAVESACDGHAAGAGQLRGEGIADQTIGTLRLHGAAGGGHQRGVADVGDLVGFR